MVLMYLGKSPDLDPFMMYLQNVLRVIDSANLQLKVKQCTLGI